MMGGMGRDDIVADPAAVAELTGMMPLAATLIRGRRRHPAPSGTIYSIMRRYVLILSSRSGT